MTHDALTSLRLRAIRWLAIAAWAWLLAEAAISARHGWAGAPVLAIGLLINLLPSWNALRHRCGGEARMVLAVTYAVHPALVVYLFEDHAWQMDSHMYFFPALAALALLCDWRPIVAAAVLVALHHLLFSYVAPSWAFDGDGDIGRVVLHASAVVLQCVALGTLADRLRRLLVAQEYAASVSASHAEQAQRAQDAAERALAAVRAAEGRTSDERRARDAFESAQRDKLLSIAEAFEATVATIVATVESAVDKLEGSAISMNDLAADTGQQAVEVACVATQASANAREVAKASTALANSINSIAQTVRQQSELSGVAQANSSASDEAVRDLAQHAVTIGGFLDTIHQIARHTNLLALNATIEAARAGEAGLGFAVVAGEVKALAGQAHDATREITALLGGIGRSAGLAERSLGQATLAVGEVVEAARTIEGAVAAQRAVAALIERNADEAATGASVIEERIGRVATAAEAASALSSQVRESVVGLSQSARALRQSTDHFVRHLRDDTQRQALAA